MAAPTAPTLSTLTAEAIQKARFIATSSTEYSTLHTRAQNYWMEEIKNDIYMLERKLLGLQTTYVHITTLGLSKYSLPTDYGINMSITLLDGSSTGTFQSGSTTGSWILDASEDATEGELMGKEILVYSGTAIRQLGQVNDYDSTTTTATVSNCTVAPVSGDKYVIVDNYYPLTPMQVWEYDSMSNQVEDGVPNRFSLLGDTDNGEFLVYPSPYRSTEVPWGIKQRYFADLMRVDLAGTLMSTLYRRWRNLFIQGVYAKCLQFNKHPDAKAELSVYGSLLNLMVNSEKYEVEAGADLQFVPQFRN